MMGPLLTALVVVVLGASEPATPVREAVETACSRRYEQEVWRTWGRYHPVSPRSAQWAQGREARLRRVEEDLKRCLEEAPATETRLLRAICRRSARTPQERAACNRP